VSIGNNRIIIIIMGQPGLGGFGGGGMGNNPFDPNKKPGDKKKDDKKKWQPPRPARVGRKKKISHGPQAAYKLPKVHPLSKCKLRLLRVERL